eukprot:Rhum_TRINITY_DN15703_c0_g1::Rhum_TRINITY_DN15703_c0_g1_i1::g.161897::m.161897
MNLQRALPGVVGAGVAVLACRLAATQRRALTSRALRVVPGAPGERLLEMDTPCLCVDLTSLDENMRRLDALLADHPAVNVRPIFKAHKCASIAAHQLTGRAPNGICCANVSEAEVLLARGITDVLVANEIIGEKKLGRLTAAMRAAGVQTLRIIVDSPLGVAQLEAAAGAASVRFDVLVDVNCGQKRCGVNTVADAVALGSLVRGSPHLRLVGLQAYQGAAQHIRAKSDMEAEMGSVVGIAAAARAALEEAGLFDVAARDVVVTGGGSGTLEYEMRSGVFTELQPGSYLFNDVDYSKNLSADGSDEGEAKWKASLFVLATVMSRTRCEDGSEYVVVDAGIKAHSIDSGMPSLYGSPSVQCQNGGDEHFKLVYAKEVAGKLRVPLVGEKVLLQPNHVDPTFNMHDHVAMFRTGKLPYSSEDVLAENPEVTDVWEIEARGPGY